MTTPTTPANDTRDEPNAKPELIVNDANATIMVDDINRTLTFYCDLLGLKPGEREGDFFAEILTPGLTIIVHPAHGAPPADGHPNLSIGLSTQDISAATSVLAAAGVDVRSDENDTNRFTFFTDPDGTPLYLIEPKS